MIVIAIGNYNIDNSVQDNLYAQARLADLEQLLVAIVKLLGRPVVEGFEDFLLGVFHVGDLFAAEIDEELALGLEGVAEDEVF